MSLKRLAVGLVILFLYLMLAAGLIYLSYQVSKPTNPDQWKEFGVRAGIALTAVGTFVGVIITLFTLNTQINAAKALEAEKGEILKGVENHKKVILEEIETLKGRISRQNDFLNRTLDIKTQAYNELFKTSSASYWELQNLAKGEFNKDRAIASEQALAVARGLAANLDKDDREIVTRILQKAYDIVDLAEGVEGTPADKKEAYIKIWNDNVTEFGGAIKELNDRSLFHQQTTQIESDSNLGGGQANANA